MVSVTLMPSIVVEPSVLYLRYRISPFTNLCVSLVFIVADVRVADVIAKTAECINVVEEAAASLAILVSLQYNPIVAVPAPVLVTRYASIATTLPAAGITTAAITAAV
jgi:hypothetical protein